MPQTVQVACFACADWGELAKAQTLEDARAQLASGVAISSSSTEHCASVELPAVSPGA